MKRSKLEMYVDILRALAQRGPLQLSHITSEANVKRSKLDEKLSFLIKQGLVNEMIVEKNNVVYSNTDRGTSVIKFFGKSDKGLSGKENSEFMPVQN